MCLAVLRDDAHGQRAEGDPRSSAKKGGTSLGGDVASDSIKSTALLCIKVGFKLLKSVHLV